MIKKLHLKDFQSHKDTTFEFDKGLTVICGASGMGKSSVIRALKYLFYNRPNHVKYQRRPDAKSFEIEAELDDCSIKRVKGKVGSKEVNQYQISFTEGKEPILWEDVGRSVPDKVTELSNIRPIIFNKETEFDIQLAKQFDGQFLLSEPDSVKLKFLNRLSGSYVVDLAAKNVGKELSDCKKKIEELDATIQELNKNLKDILEISGPFSILLSSIKEKYSMLVESYTRLEKLIELKKVFDVYEQTRLSILADETLLSKVNVAGFEFAINRLENLYRLYEDNHFVQEQLKLADSTLVRIQGLPLDQTLEKISKINDLVRLTTDYRIHLSKLSDTDREKESVDKQIDNMLQCYKEQLEKTPVCPYCNRKISSTCVNQILKELSND